jgi:hypothetical protein
MGRVRPAGWPVVSCKAVPSGRRASPSAVRAVAATDSGRLAPDLAAGIRLREEWCANTPPAALQAMDAGAFHPARIPIRTRAHAATGGWRWNGPPASGCATRQPCFCAACCAGPRPRPSRWATTAAEAALNDSSRRSAWTANDILLSMTVKNAAFFAFIGMALLTVMLAVGFIRDMSAILAGAIAAITVLISLIHLLASLSMAVFLYVFYKAQR